MPRGQTTDDASHTLFQAVQDGNTEGVKEALRDSGSPEENTTALMLAVSCGHADIVDLLLGTGIWVDARDFVGHTALFYAFCGSPVIAQHLIDAGASVSVTACGNHTPLHCFAEHDHPAGSRQDVWQLS